MVSYALPFLIYATIFCYNWLVVVSSFSVPRIGTLSYSLDSTRTDSIDPISSPDVCSHNATPGVIYTDDIAETESKLSCRVLGFYPFPFSLPRGPLGWLLKDTHQAIIVTETIPRAAKTPESRKVKLRMDFMTKDGANHPVWYDDNVKWNVFLGGDIDGEVRVKALGTKRQHPTTNGTNEKVEDTNGTNKMFEESKVFSMESSQLDAACSKLNHLIAYANEYDCRMNLYRNNCRMFAARMEREVERLNSEGTDSRSLSQKAMAADVCCALRIIWAAVLPALYPLGATLLLYEGCWIR